MCCPIKAMILIQLLGYLFHWGLFGVLCVQVCEPNLHCEIFMSFKTWHYVDMYYLAFPTDPKRNKFFVYSVFILEVMQTIMFTYTAFHVFGEGYGNLENFHSIDLAWFSVPILTGIGRHCITKLPLNLYLRDSCSFLYCANFLCLPNQRSFTIEMGRWCHYGGVHALGWSITISLNLSTFQLALLQLGGSIASAVDYKLFSKLVTPNFYIAVAVCSPCRTSYGKSSTLVW